MTATMTVQGLQVALQAMHDRMDAVVQLATCGRILLDPREVLAAAGVPLRCSCPGEPQNWRHDFDPDCPRHGCPRATDDELRQLLPKLRQVVDWGQGARHDVYADDPREQRTGHDSLLCYAADAMLMHFRAPTDQEHTS